MKTVGLLLKQAREQKGYSLSEVEKDTKIRVKFLQAIERDDYSELPSVSYAKGFVKNYSEYLDLNSQTVLAFFRRQTKEVSRASLLPKGIAEPLNKPLFRLTPARFLAILLLGLVSVVVLYLGFQYRAISEPPKLAIESPLEGTVSPQRRIEILGETDTDATVTINGTSVLVRSDGRFFDQITLEQGRNEISIRAISRFGNSTTVKRVVEFVPEENN